MSLIPHRFYVSNVRTLLCTPYSTAFAMLLAKFDYSSHRVMFT